LLLLDMAISLGAEMTPPSTVDVPRMASVAGLSGESGDAIILNIT
jgi:hypothetical protein